MRFNKKQIICTATAAIFLLSGFFLKQYQPVMISMFAGSFSFLFFAWFARNKKKPVAPEPKKEPEWTPPTQQREITPQKPQTYNEIVGGILDRCFNNAQATAKLSMTFTLPKDIEYRGKTIPTDITLKVDVDTSTEPKITRSQQQITEDPCED